MRFIDPTGNYEEDDMSLYTAYEAYEIWIISEPGLIPVDPMSGIMRFFAEPYDWWNNANEFFKGELTWYETILAGAPLISGSIVKQGRKLFRHANKLDNVLTKSDDIIKM